MRTISKLIKAAAIWNLNNLGLCSSGSLVILYDYEAMKKAIQTSNLDSFKLAIVGAIETRDNIKFGAYEVSSVWARKGYGPILYLLAVDFADIHGLIPNQNPSHLSSSAKKIWKMFYEHPDKVLVEPLKQKTLNTEPYLKIKLLKKIKIGKDVAIANHLKLVKNDKYGEILNSIVETADSILNSQMTSLYQYK